MPWNILIGSGLGLPHLTLDRVVWPLVLVIFVVQWIRGEINRYSPDWIEYSMFTFLVVILLNMYMHGTFISHQFGGDKLNLFSVLTGFFLPFMSYFIMRRGVLNNAQAKSFLTGVGLITLYLGITGLGEAWRQSWLVFPKYILDPKWGIHFGYVRGPLLSASANGLAIVMGLPILVWLFFGTRGARRWLWLLGIASVGLSLPFVFQRAVWLAASAALGIVALAWPRRRLILTGGLVLIAAVGGLMLPNTLEERIAGKLAAEGNIQYRWRLIDTTLTLIGDHLYTGVGYYQVDKFVRRSLGTGYSSHNMPLTLFAELGLLGFLPYLLIFSLLLFQSAKAYRQQSWFREIIGGMWGITAAYIIVSVTADMRTAIYMNVLLFALWGMVLGMTQRQADIRQGSYSVDRRVINFV